MRHVKHLLSFMLAAVMALAMAATPAFAANGTNDDSGAITISNAEVGHTYKAYQVLVLESYNTDAKAYSYKANDDWAEWLKSQTKYVSIDDQGYVTWAKDADVAAFAKAALAYAEANSISPAATKTADNATVQFTGLNLGYYLVDTTVGSLCSLDTTTPNVEMKEKNKVPPVEKQVQEDSNKSWGDSSTAEIGDTVPFKTTITADEGAQNYVLHDDLSAGLTLNKDSIKVTGLTEGEDYTVTTEGLNDGCDFHVTFTQAYLDSITDETKIEVTYTAVLNENALIADEDNPNKTALDKAYVIRDKDTKFFINDSDVDVTETEGFADVSLLFDDIVTDGNTEGASDYYSMLTDKAVDEAAEGMQEVKYEAKYLDLVDANNGNVWLTPSEKVTIYWPYPVAPTPTPPSSWFISKILTVK